MKELELSLMMRFDCQPERDIRPLLDCVNGFYSSLMREEKFPQSFNQDILALMKK